MLKKVSDVLVPLYYNTAAKLGLESNIIVIDESKFGKRKYNRGHPIEGVWIAGMSETSSDKKVKLYQ